MTASASAFRDRNGGKPAPAIGKGADPGQHHAVGAGDVSGALVTLDFGGNRRSPAAARSNAFAAERRLPEP